MVSVNPISIPINPANITYTIKVENILRDIVNNAIVYKKMEHSFTWGNKDGEDYKHVLLKQKFCPLIKITVSPPLSTSKPITIGGGTLKTTTL